MGTLTGKVHFFIGSRRPMIPLLSYKKKAVFKTKLLAIEQNFRSANCAQHQLARSLNSELKLYRAMRMVRF